MSITRIFTLIPYFAFAIVVVTTWEITMKYILIALLGLLVYCISHHANAWNAAGMQYMYQQPEPQQNQQPTYSQQYNAGYMDAYQNAHGYASSTGQGNAYSEGYRAAWRAERRQ